MCSYSFANKRKVLGVQMSERANIFSVYLAMYFEICTFRQQKFGTWQHISLYRIKNKVIMKKKYNIGERSYMPSWLLLVFSLAYLKYTAFIPVTFSYGHRSVGFSLNSCAIFIYIFILCVSTMNKKLKFSEPQWIEVIF